jgi:hypothetical protein
MVIALLRVTEAVLLIPMLEQTTTNEGDKKFEYVTEKERQGGDMSSNLYGSTGHGAYST